MDTIEEASTLGLKPGEWPETITHNGVVYRRGEPIDLIAAERDIKQALREIFEVSEKVVTASVWRGDPYNWSANAIFTISTEHGIPSNYEPELTEMWFAVSDRIRQHGLFCEAVNGGVTAVHRTPDQDREITAVTYLADDATLVVLND